MMIDDDLSAAAACILFSRAGGDLFNNIYTGGVKNGQGRWVVVLLLI